MKSLKAKQITILSVGESEFMSSMPKEYTGKTGGVSMFERKQQEQRLEILEKIDFLLQNQQELPLSEKNILLDYHSRIEKARKVEFEVVKLRNTLLPLVVSSKLSQPVLDFYKEIRLDRKISWGEGSSLITGLAQLPKEKE